MQVLEDADEDVPMLVLPDGTAADKVRPCTCFSY
jgi:hypothetical protein